MHSLRYQRTSTTWFHRFSAVPELMAKASALVGVPFEEGRWEEAQTVSNGQRPLCAASIQLCKIRHQATPTGALRHVLIHKVCAGFGTVELE